MSPITALPDEILMKIFKEVENSYGRYTRTHLPLVCKRWGQIIFGSRGTSGNSTISLGSDDTSFGVLIRHGMLEQGYSSTASHGHSTTVFQS